MEERKMLEKKLLKSRALNSSINITPFNETRWKKNLNK